MSGEQDREALDMLVRSLARHVLTHLAPEFCTADCMARAVLASDWLADLIRRERASALLEAADDFARNPMPSFREVRDRVARILRDRADRIEAKP